MYSLSIGIVVASQELWDEIQTALYDQPARVVMERREIGDWGLFLEKLDQLRPDVLLVDLSQLADPLEDVIRQIKSTAGAPTVIVIHSAADPVTILGAVRAGADEYVYPPLKDDLTNALKRMSTERAKRRAGTRPRGKVFGFLSAKGGCGATTIACHLAAELHRQTDLLVLLADFDIDVGVVGFLMKSQNRYSVLDAVANVHRLDLSFWKALVSNGVPGVEVISAPSSSVSRKDGKVEEFADVLRFVRSNYDWTMVDIGRGLTPLAMNVLEELDQLFLVTTVDIPALHRAKQIVRTLHDAGYGSHRLNLLLNCLPKRTDVSVSELERMLGTPVYETIPGDYAGLHDAYAEGRLLAPNSKLGKRYSRLAMRMAGIQQTRKKHSFLGL